MYELTCMAHTYVAVGETPPKPTPMTTAVTRQTHPLGVRPWGNALVWEGQRANRDWGLGDAAVLPDHLVLHMLSVLDAQSLIAWASTSRTARCFGLHPPLWKQLVLESGPVAQWRWAGSWRRTWRLLHFGAPDAHEARKRRRTGHDGVACGDQSAREGAPVDEQVSPTAPQGPPPSAWEDVAVFSDVLYKPWVCASATSEAEWAHKDNIERVDGTTLSVEDFIRLYEEPGKPVILTGLVQQWKAWSEWQLDTFPTRWPSTAVMSVGPTKMHLASYWDYMMNALDDDPLYLFDKHFTERLPGIEQEYETPKFFGPDRDLFSLLGSEKRPDWRWLIIGGMCSGSSFHKDPNGTSAWNAVVRGKKKWVLYPPHATPPGVIASADFGEVATPVSCIEWFIDFYHESQDAEVQRRWGKPIEAVQAEGELLFVPCGWWHAVINCEPSIAITHNYVSQHNCQSVRRFLHKKPQQVSGVPHDEQATLAKRFDDALRTHLPQYWAEKCIERESQWSRVVSAQQDPDEDTQGGWKFGFGQ